MWGSPWRVGLDIQTHAVQAVAVEKRCRRWQLCQWWRHRLPTGTFQADKLQQPESLSTTLLPWRKMLPSNFLLHIALPHTLMLQQTVDLPSHIGPTTYDWYVEMLIPKLFPLPTAELCSDFRQSLSNTPQLTITVARRSVLNSWLTALSAAELTPTVVDSVPFILRQIVRQQALDPHALLLHLYPENALVVSPLNAQYTCALMPKGPSLLAMARQWCATTVGFEPSITLISGEIEHYLTTIQDPTLKTWSPFAFLTHKKVALPPQPALFAIACGLALRAEDQ